MKKLFNFSLGGNATTSNIKEESVPLSICVCVCVCVCFVCVKQYVCVCVCVCVYFYFLFKKKNLKQCVKKNDLKKLCIKQ